MREIATEVGVERKANVGRSGDLQPDWIAEALHQLSQPLTALECGLYIGTMSPDGVRAPTREELMATILGALEQCERLTLNVRALQDRLQPRH